MCRITANIICRYPGRAGAAERGATRGGAPQAAPALIQLIKLSSLITPSGLGWSRRGGPSRRADELLDDSNCLFVGETER